LSVHDDETWAITGHQIDRYMHQLASGCIATIPNRSLQASTRMLLYSHNTKSIAHVSTPMLLYSYNTKSIATCINSHAVVQLQYQIDRYMHQLACCCTATIPNRSLHASTRMLLYSYNTKWIASCTKLPCCCIATLPNGSLHVPNCHVVV
jgi:hypothetical protein